MAMAPQQKDECGRGVRI